GTNQFSLSVYRWDAATGKKLAALSAPHRPAETAEQGLFGLALSADGRLVAAQTTIDSTVRVFGAAEGREGTEITANGERGPGRAGGGLAARRPGAGGDGREGDPPDRAGDRPGAAPLHRPRAQDRRAVLFAGRQHAGVGQPGHNHPPLGRERQGRRAARRAD